MQSANSSGSGLVSRSGTCSTSCNELRRRILTSRFFARAPEHPGFLAAQTPTGPVIPVFTSLALLELHAGAVRWFSTTGADLMALAPVGHRFVIDPGSPNQMVIDPSAFVSGVFLTSDASRHEAG